MADETHDFQQFMQRREQAAQAYVSGDAAPLSTLATRLLPATFFHPQGTYYQGADEVLQKYVDDAQSFASGSETHFEVLQMAASEGIGYWVGIQHAQARMQGQNEAIPMAIRVTEIFRREGDEWKMVHRHADALRMPSDEQG